MTSFSKIASVAILSGMAAVNGAMPANAGGKSVYNVTPLKGVTLTVGPKRAIGYFQQKDGACHLTLMLADPYTDGRSANEPVRIKTTIRGGARAEIDTQAGRSLLFACADSADAMAITPIERVAYATTVSK